MQQVSLSSAAEVENYEACKVCVEELAVYLKPISGAKGLSLDRHVCFWGFCFWSFETFGHL